MNLLPLAIALLLPAQFDPPKTLAPDAATLKKITDKTAELDEALGDLRRFTTPDGLMADVEIYANAAKNIVAFEEWFNKDSAAWTLEILDKGLARAKSILDRKGAPWRTDVAGKTTVRGYRSQVDGTAQPYAVTFPASFGKDKKKWRTDVVLHGRNSSFTEVAFLRADGRKLGDNPYVQIDIAGRGNNAYRWAGEADVHEAMNNYFNQEPRLEILKSIDKDRVVLRGFSMGGAGTWHLGLHFPDRWCVMSPGAGFTTTHGYIGGLPKELPAHQEACLKIYDAVDYAENAAAIPIVAYSGGKDPQKAAADNIEARVKSLGLSMVHFIAPDAGHTFLPEYVKKAEVLWASHAEKGRSAYPAEVHFTTYTLKYPSCDWVKILGLDKHYEKTQVDAKRTADGFDVKTRNVAVLGLVLEEKTSKKQKVTIDGQELNVSPTLVWGLSEVLLEKDGKTWKSLQFEDWNAKMSARKLPGSQGPIDDAFAGPFLCVKGTGKTWHPDTQKYVDADLARFQAEFARYMRGKVRVKNDVDITEADVKNHNLILFGDPSSNSVLAKIAKDLPITWTEKNLTMAGQSVPSAGHLPVLIHPNPLRRDRMVVLNSGHTFHAKEFQGTNAQLYPRLGDYALLRIPEGGGLGAEVVTAGLFDENWRFPK